MRNPTMNCCYSTADETRNQVNAVFESRLPEVEGAINKMTKHDDDLKQDALLGVFKLLQIDPEAPKGYMINHARWGMLSSKQRGVSVDSSRRECDEFHVIGFEDYELQDSLMAEIADCNGDQPVEDTAIFNLDLQRFIDKLSPVELEFVQLKTVADWPEYRIIDKMGIKRLTVESLRMSLRKKFDLSFGV